MERSCGGRNKDLTNFDHGSYLQRWKNLTFDTVTSVRLIESDRDWVQGHAIIMRILMNIHFIYQYCTYNIFLFIFSAHFIPIHSGGRLLMYDTYTFSLHSKKFKMKSKRRWRCSLEAKGCTAVIYTDGEKIISQKANHSHEPPRYIINKGIYVKI